MKYLSNLPESTVNEIIDLLQKYQDAWNNKQPREFVELFDDASEFTDIIGQIAIGKEQNYKMHNFIFQRMMKSAVLTLSDLYLRAISADNILVTAKWKTVGHTNPQGESLPERMGIMQIICHKTTKGWLISLVHNTDLTQHYSQIEGYKMKFFE